MTFVEIEWQSDLYRQEVAMRDAILRKPLGLIFTDDDLAAEETQHHFGIVEDDNLVACVVVVTLSTTAAKLRQMAVAEARQNQGLGATLMRNVEEKLRERGVTNVELHARDIAIGFYEKLGYRTAGDGFIEVGIQHYKMVKEL